MMNATTRLAACAMLLWAGAALATPTPQQKCDSARITAWKVYASCVDSVVAKDAKGVIFDEFKAFWKCRHAYFKKWAGFQGKAKYAGSTCDETVPAIGGRFKDNGDQTVTDNFNGLVWEKKIGENGSPSPVQKHDADNIYTWSTGAPYKGDGTAFSDFLTAFPSGLNVAVFAGAQDWRLPTLAELQTILADFPCKGVGETSTCACPSVPCVDPTLDSANTQQERYWSATSTVDNPLVAWRVNFFSGEVGGLIKTTSFYVRAVRGGL